MMPASAPFRVMRGQNNASRMVGPKTAPKPAQAYSHQIQYLAFGVHGEGEGVQRDYNHGRTAHPDEFGLGACRT